MVIPTYTLGYPPDGSSLGQTKSTIRNNLDGTFETLAIDHINNNGQPGSQPAGYHTVIHQVPQTSVSTVTGYNQVFSGVPGTLIVNGVTTPTIPPGGDQQLYSLTGGGILSQLTGNVSSSSGYTWAGGVLLQWGSASVATGVAISFAIAFPNNIWSVVPSIVSPNGFKEFIMVLSGSVSKSGFTPQLADLNGFIGSNRTVYYFAVGN